MTAETQNIKKAESPGSVKSYTAAQSTYLYLEDQANEGMTPAGGSKGKQEKPRITLKTAAGISITIDDGSKSIEIKRNDQTYVSIIDNEIYIHAAKDENANDQSEGNLKITVDNKTETITGNSHSMVLGWTKFTNVDSHHQNKYGANSSFQLGASNAMFAGEQNILALGAKTTETVAATLDLFAGFSLAMHAAKKIEVGAFKTEVHITKVTNTLNATRTILEKVQAIASETAAFANQTSAVLNAVNTHANNTNLTGTVNNINATSTQLGSIATEVAEQLIYI